MEQDTLPIPRSKAEILHSVRNFPTTIIVGETGSGKSTQLPQFLIEIIDEISKPSTPNLINSKLPKKHLKCSQDINLKKIVCTQPRRVATISVAARVAAEMKTQVGELSDGFLQHCWHCTKI
jgi:pre-mRNA-splicing factor ATP-dependent RNA helicase DHX15/PRP43